MLGEHPNLGDGVTLTYLVAISGNSPGLEAKSLWGTPWGSDGHTKLRWLKGFVMAIEKVIINATSALVDITIPERKNSRALETEYSLSPWPIQEWTGHS